MKKNILLKTNILICLILVVGFLLTAVLSYKANYSASLESVEQVSTLTSEGMYYQINSIFTKPVNISLTMASDSLLKELLLNEEEHLEEEQYIETIRNYLDTYRDKYVYDSVFLVSSQSGRYYNFNGLDRVLTKDNPENVWYFDMLESDEDYSINVDNDEVDGADNEITVFVNCKIKSDDGDTMGIIGVGVRINHLQKLLQGYQDEFGVNAFLVNDEGIIEISTDYTGFEGVNLFEDKRYSDDVKEEILSWKQEGTSRDFWVEFQGSGEKRDYIVVRYLPELQWHLIVERDTSIFVDKLNRQLTVTVLVIIAIILFVLLIITSVIRTFNQQVIQLTQSVERERRTLFEKTTEQMFDKIYELDITNNCPANKAAEEYFEKLGAPAGTPYDKALRIIAESQIKEEFREGYIESFKPENVLRAYKEGKDTLRYEFMMLGEDQDYYWTRITARIVPWETDGTIHVLTYRQNIDAEIRQEHRLLELARTDEMTGLLTKSATEQRIKQLLEENPDNMYAFFIFDIDHFKNANDLYGHSFGDYVIKAFAKKITDHFREGDLIGRVGGDEFVVFIPVPDEAWVYRKADELSAALNWQYTRNEKTWKITTSIGIAIDTDGVFDNFYENADKALYKAKENGRSQYMIHEGKEIWH